MGRCNYQATETVHAQRSAEQRRIDKNQQSIGL
jgi:hypothetical protein